MKEKFYICKHCGNIITFIEDKGVPVKCCGENMSELIPNTTDAVTEKHVPEVKVEGNKVLVQVGSVLHPMLEEHHISWVSIATNLGCQIKYFKVDGEPKAEFYLADGEELQTVYEYCNLHGLWKKDI